jgi:serine/threonine-protein kinase RsbW
MHPDRALYQRRVPATPEGVRAALGGLSAAIAPLALTLEEAASVQLVLAEALNNIVEHAYAGVDGDHIAILVRQCSDGLHCRLRDSGAPMPDGQAPLGDYSGPATCIDDQPESGFGWFLIRNLARDLEYRRVDGGNELAFRIALRPGQVRL